MFAYNLYRLGAFLALRLSLPTARRIAAAVGRLSCALQRRTRRHLIENLRTAFGDTMSERELRGLRLRIYANFAVFVADFLRFPFFTRDNLGEWLTERSIEGLARLRQTGAGGPLVFLTAHLGNWELGAAAVALAVTPLTVLADTHPSPRVTAFFNGRRESKGCAVVTVSSFHRCFRALKGGGAVAIVGDRPVTGQGIHATFMGKTTLVPDGHAVLARRLGATLVPCFLLMTEDGRYDLLVDDPIVPRTTDDEAGDVRDCVNRCLTVVERRIREHPEQWYVFRPIWGGEAARTARGRRGAARVRSAR
ncbi:MAG: lysophospholipid acyltransferase family protein [Candidatus Eisenbacteria bacterium]|nr:lysophospholipid acyltransferase family protein [Candidatus Eisenbacteria bacterium]